MGRQPKEVARGPLVGLWGCSWKERQLRGVRLRKKRRRIEEGANVGPEAEADGERSRGRVALPAGAKVDDPSRMSRQVIFGCPLPGGRTNYGGSAKDTLGSS